MEKTKLIPAIRFSGFADDWGRRSLGSMGTTYTGLSGKAKEDFGHGDAKFITYMNVFSNPISDPDMIEPIEIDNKQEEVEIGDVFFTTSSETPEEVGMSSVLLKKEGCTYLNSFCFGYRPTVKLNPNYLAFMLRSKDVRKDIVFLAQGISRYNISKNKMMEIEVPIPSIDEQDKIGNYFRSLDSLITFHQCKLEKMKTVKNSLLEKMFPRNDSDVPEIRAKGFTDQWKKYKFLNLYRYASEGGTPDTNNPNYYDGGKIPFVKIEDTFNKYIESTNTFISEDGMNNSSAWLIPEGSVIFTNGATVGNVAINKLPVATKQGILGIIPSSVVSSEFLYYLLSGTSFQTEVRKKMATGTFSTIILKNLNEISVYCPDNLEEQHAICNLFSELDNLIVYYKRELEKLKVIKKAFLDKMFVKVEV